MNPAVCGVENIAGAEDPPLPPVANCPVGLKQNLDNFTETGHSHQFRLLPPHYDCPIAPPFAASRQASAAALLLVAGRCLAGAKPHGALLQQTPVARNSGSITQMY